MSASQFEWTAVNTSKHAAEKNANEWLSSDLNGAHWRSRETAKPGGNYLWVHYFRLTSHIQCFFFYVCFMNVNEKLKSRPTLTVVRLSNVKDLICPFSKNTFNTFGIRSRESSLSIVWKRLRVKSLSAVIESKFVHCYWKENKKKQDRVKRSRVRNKPLVNEQWTHWIFNSKRRFKTLEWVAGRGGRFGSWREDGGPFQFIKYVYSICMLCKENWMAGLNAPDAEFHK